MTRTRATWWRRWLLHVHLAWHPGHALIGQHGYPDACGPCSGFTPGEVESGACSHHPAPWWRVEARRKYRRGGIL